MVSFAILTFHGSRIAQIVFSSIFSIAVIVLNIVLIGSILSRKELRSNSKYILILLLAVADFYTGVFVIPLFIHMMVTQILDYPCLLTKALYGSSYLHIAMSCLAVVSLNLDYIFQKAMASYQGTVRKLLTLVLAVLFFILPFIVLVPILVNGQSPDLSPSCILVLEVPYARAAVALSYWVPAGCIIITTIIVIVVHKKNRRQQTHLQYPGAPPQASALSTVNQSNPSDLILAAALTVALNFPSEVLDLTEVNCGYDECTLYFNMVTAFGYFSDAKAFLLPLVWFMNRDFRNTVTGRSSTPDRRPILGQNPMYSNYTQPQGQVLANPVAHDQDNVYPNSGFQASGDEKQ